VRAEIADLQQRMRTTMIYVTHDQTEAMTLGDRVAVLDRGRLQQVAPPRELYDRPANAFVAGFIGTPPMNLFPAEIGADRTSLVVAGERLPLPSPPPASLPARVTAGIRPEAFRPAEGPAGVGATVEHVEWLGHETLVHARVGAAAAETSVRLVARLPGMHQLEKGAGVRLAVSGEVHFFDAGGRRVD
jgi:ABC-type sugar transport system ATPase subunit